MTAARKAYYASKKKRGGAKKSGMTTAAYEKMRAARTPSIKKAVAKQLKNKVVGSGGSMAAPIKIKKVHKYKSRNYT